jgi:hypothetical protein
MRAKEHASPSLPLLPVLRDVVMLTDTALQIYKEVGFFF